MDVGSRAGDCLCVVVLAPKSLFTCVFFLARWFARLFSLGIWIVLGCLLWSHPALVCFLPLWCFLVSLASRSVYGARTLGVGFLYCWPGGVLPSPLVACVAIFPLLGLLCSLLELVSWFQAFPLECSPFLWVCSPFEGWVYCPFSFFLGPLLFRFLVSRFRGLARSLVGSVGVLIYPLCPSFLALPAFMSRPGVS